MDSDKKSNGFISIFARILDVLHEAFSDAVLSESQVYKWHKKFQMVGLLLRMIRIQDVQRLQQRVILVSKFYK